MKLKTTVLSATILGLSWFHASAATDWTAGFQEGKPLLQSISQLSFGPDGILFVADTKAAAVVAIATGDTKPAVTNAKDLSIEGINLQIAALLGTKPEEILISDLTVNPLSHQAYLAVSRGRGPDAVPVLIRASAGGKLEVVSLDKVNYSRAELPNAPADGVVGEGKRQSNPRLEAITDIAFVEDRLLIAGLSNEEFSSSLRSIPFPFKTAAGTTSVEIYHGAHGRYETRAPIRTFVPFQVGGEPSLIAAYTCTPLVQFPLKDLQTGAKVQGKTIAELGNRNRPIDLIVYEKEGKSFLLLANNARGIMKLSTEAIPTVEKISEPVSGGGTKGLPFEPIAAWDGVTQLSALDSAYALVLRSKQAGVENLEALPLP